jgi:hypothetical protein
MCCDELSTRSVSIYVIKFKKFCGPDEAFRAAPDLSPENMLASIGLMMLFGWPSLTMRSVPPTLGGAVCFVVCGWLSPLVEIYSFMIAYSCLIDFAVFRETIWAFRGSTPAA